LLKRLLNDRAKEYKYKQFKIAVEEYVDNARKWQ